MKINTLISAAATVVTFATPTFAFWRMSCPGRILTERLDPIVAPGLASSHSHTISGGNGFNMNMNYNDTQSSTCSSCPIKQDLSNYWTPNLYYQMKNGSVQAVPQAGDGTGVYGGMTVYYLQRGGPNNDKLHAYPEGFRMLAGSPNKRSLTNDFAGQAVSYVCLNYSTTSTYTSELPDHPCPDGLRAQIFFPSCWDGVNLDSADHMSHMAYPTQYSYDNGPCPASHPVHMISVFFEVIYSTAGFDWWVPDNGWQPFVFSNGDPTGYGFHGDFFNGWNVSALQEATDTCLNDSGQPSDCPVFDFFSDADSQGCLVAPTVQETVTGTLDQLPGCNPITYANATSQKCSQPTIGAAQTYYKNVTGWNYLGCGTDVTGNRTFAADYWWDNGVTVEGCLNYCGAKGYSYAGLEYGNQCFCSKTLAADRAPKTGIMGNCFTPCAGNSSEYCGGASRLSMYYQNGTYVPLNTTSTKITCPSSNNTMYASTNGTFQVQCGIDRAGGDIGMAYVTAGNITQCMDTCAKTKGCSFLSLSGSACYMKGGNLKAPVANSGVYGAYIVSAATQSSTTATSSATSSATIVSSSSSTSASGNTTATANKAVNAVTSSSTTLSTTTSVATTSSTTTSAGALTTSTNAPSCPGSNATYYQATTGSIFLIECGVDHAGGDMAATSVSSFQGCIETCAGLKGCVDVSLSGSACYMKKTLGQAVYGNSGLLGAKLISSGASSSSSSTTSKSTTTSASSSVASSTITAAPSVGSDGITTVNYAPSCTAINTNTYAVTDSAGVGYLYMCGGGTGGTTMAVSAGVPNWNSCFAICDSTTGCSGFTYNQGAAFGNGTGQCLLKSGSPNSFTSLDNMLSTRVGGLVRASMATTTKSSSTTPATASATATAANLAAASASSSSTTTTLQTSTSTSSAATGTPTVTDASCPQNNGTIFVDPNSGSRYLLECSIDHAGGDLSMTYVSNLAGCIAACSAFSGCVDVSLSGTACYMKSSVGNAVQNGGVQGAKLLPAVASTTAATATAGATGVRLGPPVAAS